MISLLLPSVLSFGCGTGINQLPSSARQSVLSGAVRGGQQPITGASIQLYAVGQSGDQSEATPLLLQPKLTDTTGAFSLSGLYACPSTSSLLYLTASGGDAGLTKGTSNPNILLMAALGPCGTINGSSSIVINEVTTVAAANGLMSFMATPFRIGSSQNDAAILESGFVTATELANPATGSSPGVGVPEGQTVQSTKLLTLANITANCVNSAGGAAGDSSPCGQLFSLATTAQGTAPTDTASALLAIAQNPYRNVLPIFLLSLPQAPFEPTLLSAPSNWSLAITSPTPTPVMSPAPGEFSLPTLIGLSDATGSASLYYTTDGSQPTSNSTPYTGPFQISATESVKAIAVANGISSVPAIGTYVIDASDVTISLTPSETTLGPSQTVQLVPSVSGTSNTGVSWSLSPQLGTVSGTGIYMAPATIASSQVISVIATSVADPTKMATALIQLVPSGGSGNSGVGTVNALGATPVPQPLSGLGFNIDPGNQWEFELAAKAGATHVRFQCGWTTTEMQTPPPLDTVQSTQYILEPDCVSGLAYSKQYGMKPTIIAAFGAPYHTILNVSLPSGAAAGATTLHVQFASGAGGDTISSLRPFYDTIIASNGAQISNRHSYAGDLVTGVTMTDSTHATLTLASALTSSLPANSATQYIVNEYLYPPAATFGPSDPSVIAFSAYARFLANSIANAGLSGDVELWNEPPWSDDPWDERADYYDNFPGSSSPGPQAAGQPNWGFVAYLQSQAAPPAGVTYTWAGTNKSGDNSVLDPSMQSNTGVSFHEPATIVAAESIHPYGNNPEDEVWSEPCLKATIYPYPIPPAYFAPCNLLSSSTSNALKAEQESLVMKSQNPAWGIQHSITETGFSQLAGDNAHQARFIMRQFLGFQAAGVTPIEFYRLYDTSPDDLGFTNPANEAPLPSFTAIAGLMSDLDKIGNSPVAGYSLSTLSSVVSYSGTYPLNTMHMVGSRSGDTSNSEIFALWQESNVAQGSLWGTLPQPVASPVTVAIPVGSTVVSVINLDTRQAVPYVITGQTLSFFISDDPVGVLIEPAS